jgi:hypothetical protein
MAKPSVYFKRRSGTARERFQKLWMKSIFSVIWVNTLTNPSVQSAINRLRIYSRKLENLRKRENPSNPRVGGRISGSLSIPRDFVHSEHVLPQCGERRPASDHNSVHYRFCFHDCRSRLHGSACDDDDQLRSDLVRRFWV